MGFVAQYIHKTGLLQVALGSPALVAHMWPRSCASQRGALD